MIQALTTVRESLFICAEHSTTLENESFATGINKMPLESLRTAT